MGGRWVSGVIAGALVAIGSANPAWAAPEREGFTGDLGLGLALTASPRTNDVICLGTGCPDEGTTHELHVGFGLAPLSFSLGGFLTPDFALLFRATGTTYFEDGDAFASLFYGPVVEYWLHDRFSLSGGAGLGLFTEVNSNSEDETSLALDLRASVALINATHHDLTLSLELTPAFYREFVLGTALVVAWKWY